MQPNVSLLSENPRKLYRKYTVHYHALIEPHYGYKNIAFIPGIIFQKQAEYYQTLFGSYFYYDFLSTGIWLRNNRILSTNSLILILGIRLNSFKFDYSYEISLFNNQLFSYKMSSHEVTLSVLFQYKEKTKRNKAIKCPKI